MVHPAPGGVLGRLRACWIAGRASGALAPTLVCSGTGKAKLHTLLFHKKCATYFNRSSDQSVWRIVELVCLADGAHADLRQRGAFRGPLAQCVCNDAVSCTFDAMDDISHLKLLTVPEVATALRVSPRYIRSRIKDGHQDAPSVTAGGNLMMVHESSRLLWRQPLFSQMLLGGRRWKASQLRASAGCGVT
jgi:hypothetical protein